MRKKQVLLIFLLIGAVGLLQGCLVAAVGAGAVGTMAYIQGDLEAVESEGLDVVYKATLMAVDELELNVTKKLKDALSAIVVARDAQDRKVTIKLNAAAEGTTKLSIRVGVFGNETRSRLIYQKIRDNIQQ